MTYRYNRGYQYRLTNPPKALLKARMDNIAIVPASMLPLTETLKERINTLPSGAVLLCYAEENTRQRKILARVEETFRDTGIRLCIYRWGRCIQRAETVSFSCIWGLLKSRCATTERQGTYEQKISRTQAAAAEGAGHVLHHHPCRMEQVAELRVSAAKRPAVSL